MINLIYEKKFVKNLFNKYIIEKYSHFLLVISIWYSYMAGCIRTIEICWLFLINLIIKIIKITLNHFFFENILEIFTIIDKVIINLIRRHSKIFLLIVLLTCFMLNDLGCKLLLRRYNDYFLHLKI